MILARRGQAEVIAGLIVLTLIFVFAVPLIIAFIEQTGAASRALSEVNQAGVRALSERVSIVGEGSGGQATFWINNTGTTIVELDSILFLEEASGVIVASVRAVSLGSADIDFIVGVSMDPRVQAATNYLLMPPGSWVMIVVDLDELGVSDVIVRALTSTGTLHPREAPAPEPIAPPPPQPLNPLDPINNIWDDEDVRGDEEAFEEAFLRYFKPGFMGIDLNNYAWIPLYAIKYPPSSISFSIPPPEDPFYPLLEGFWRRGYTYTLIYSINGSYVVDNPFSFRNRYMCLELEGAVRVSNSWYEVGSLFMTGEYQLRRYWWLPCNPSTPLSDDLIVEHPMVRDPLLFEDYDGDSMVEVLLNTYGATPFDRRVYDSGIVFVSFTVEVPAMSIPASSYDLMVSITFDLRISNFYYAYRDNRPLIIVRLYEASGDRLDFVGAHYVTYATYYRGTVTVVLDDQREVFVFRGLSPSKSYVLEFIIVDGMVYRGFNDGYGTRLAIEDISVEPVY